MELIVNGQTFQVEDEGDSFVVNGERYSVRVSRQWNIVTVYVNDRPLAVQLPTEGGFERDKAQVLVDAKVYDVEIKSDVIRRSDRKQPASSSVVPTATHGTVVAQMTGLVIKVAVSSGSQVQAGDLLLVLESMKMENEIHSPSDGVVKEVTVGEGDRVKVGDVLVKLEDEA